MKVGDLVRISSNRLEKFGHFEHLSGKVYIVEEIIDHGVLGRGGTCYLLPGSEPDSHGRRMKFFQSHLEVVNEANLS